MNQDERKHVEGAAEGTESSDRAQNVEEPERVDVEQQESAPENRGRDHSQDSNSQDNSRDNNDTGRSQSEELARMREAMLRLQAEMDNREKRLEREMAKSRKFALESLMRDLVQVLDSMDQALSSADAESARTAYEGMELTRKQALQVLTSHGLEVLDPAGERFDPSWHEAMATEPSDEYEAETVSRVLQKGYRLNERLIRPARVIVAS